MKISVFAVDLAKQQFEVRGYGAGGELGVSRRLSRAGMKKFFGGQAEPGEVVMEACATSHYWGRWLQAQG